MTYSSTVTQQGGTLVFTPVGWVDGAVVETFTTDVVAAARQAKAADGLLIDLSQLAFMISRGLRALTMAQREGVKIELANPNEKMTEILGISRYDKLFPIINAP